VAKIKKATLNQAVGLAVMVKKMPFQISKGAPAAGLRNVIMVRAVSAAPIGDQSNQKCVVNTPAQFDPDQS
jgi:hypothetical protein